MTDQPQAPRQTYYAEVEERSKQFAKQLLHEIPELEGLTIVPSWRVQQDRLPAGIMAGRDGPLTHASELMHMGIQLHRVMYDHLGKFVGLLGKLDAAVVDLTLAANARKQELDGFEQQLLVASANATPAAD